MKEFFKSVIYIIQMLLNLTCIVIGFECFCHLITNELTVEMNCILGGIGTILIAYAFNSIVDLCKKFMLWISN